MLEVEKDDKLEKRIEETNSILKFQLSFLGENQRIHKVEVKNINFQDLMRHFQHGESVLITPKFLENRSTPTGKQEHEAPWYFTHF